ncbi:hypothetical protein [Lyngbya aestuarii]|uniref:hypothetical protein n=1 Tax=Lyngbya aestuarii TaxID=118322 RepID=UPI00403D601C
MSWSKQTEKIFGWKQEDSTDRVSGIIINAEVITESKQAQEELKQISEKLQQSNRYLEQFAYLTSHDLQELLRAVNSYTQLLTRKYQGNLGPTAD